MSRKQLVMFMNALPACIYVNHMPCMSDTLSGQRRAFGALELESRKVMSHCVEA